MQKSNFVTTVEYAPTTDGWELALTRHKPANFNRDRPPVLLCHGFASNRYDLDFDGGYGKHSLAKYLANRGFDIWVLELRGHGRSRKKGIRGWFNWNFDTYVDHDAPDAVDYIIKKYLKEGVDTKVMWIGHSMGGMIAYAYGSSKEGQENLKGVVTIASPAKLSGLLKNLEGLALQWLIGAVKARCPHRLNQPFFTPFYLDMKWSKRIIEKFFANKDNMNTDVLDKFWGNGIETISCKKLYQFAFMLGIDDFCTFPEHPKLCTMFQGTPLNPLFCPKSYAKNLKDFVAPLLAIAGNGDKVGVKDDVFKIKELVGSDDVTLKLLSKDNSSADYGHLDLILGFNSEIEVFKAIYDWLEKHS